MTENLVTKVQESLDEFKAYDVVTMDVANLTDFTDNMVIACGSSSTHVRAIAENLITKLKQQQIEIIGTEGEQEAEWVLIDVGSLIIHIMQKSTREFYNLEKLWQPIDSYVAVNA